MTAKLKKATLTLVTTSAQQAIKAGEAKQAMMEGLISEGVMPADLIGLGKDKGKHYDAIYYACSLAFGPAVANALNNDNLRSDDIVTGAPVGKGKDKRDVSVRYWRQQVGKLVSAIRSALESHYKAEEKKAKLAAAQTAKQEAEAAGDEEGAAEAQLHAELAQAELDDDEATKVRRRVLEYLNKARTALQKAAVMPVHGGKVAAELATLIRMLDEGKAYTKHGKGRQEAEPAKEAA